MASAIRFSLSILREMADNTKKLEVPLKELHKALVDTPNGSLFCSDIAELDLDNILDEARDYMALLFVEKQTSLVTELAMRIIIRLGLVRDNPEDVLIAVNLIKTHPEKVGDLRNEMMSLEHDGKTAKSSETDFNSKDFKVVAKRTVQERNSTMSFWLEGYTNNSDVARWATLDENKNSKPRRR